MRLTRRASRKSPRAHRQNPNPGISRPEETARVLRNNAHTRSGMEIRRVDFFRLPGCGSRSQKISQPAFVRPIDSAVGRILGPRVRNGRETPPSRRTRPAARARVATAMSSVGASSGWRSAVFNRRTLHVCAFAALLHFKPSEPHLGGCPPAIPRARPATIPARPSPPTLPSPDPSPPFASPPPPNSFVPQSPTSRTSRVSPTRRSRATSSP